MHQDFFLEYIDSVKINTTLFENIARIANAVQVTI